MKILATIAVALALLITPAKADVGRVVNTDVVCEQLDDALVMGSKIAHDTLKEVVEYATDPDTSCSIENQPVFSLLLTKQIKTINGKSMNVEIWEGKSLNTNTDVGYVFKRGKPDSGV